MAHGSRWGALQAQSLHAFSLRSACTRPHACSLQSALTRSCRPGQAQPYPAAISLPSAPIRPYRLGQAQLLQHVTPYQLRVLSCVARADGETDIEQDPRARQRFARQLLRALRRAGSDPDGGHAASSLAQQGVHVVPCPPPPPAWLALEQSVAEGGVTSLWSHLGDELVEVLPTPGPLGNRCQLARQPFGRGFRDPAITSFLSALFASITAAWRHNPPLPPTTCGNSSSNSSSSDSSDSSGSSGCSSSTGSSNSGSSGSSNDGSSGSNSSSNSREVRAGRVPRVHLSRYDLFHAHLVLAPHADYKDAEDDQDGARGLALVFHCQETPAFDAETFPYYLGWCQEGSHVIYEERLFDLRNVVWFGGQLAFLDAGVGSAIHSELLWECTRPLRTVYESDLGEPLADINLLLLAHPAGSRSKGGKGGTERHAAGWKEGSNTVHDALAAGGFSSQPRPLLNQTVGQAPQDDESARLLGKSQALEEQPSEPHPFQGWEQEPLDTAMSQTPTASQPNSSGVKRFVQCIKHLVSSISKPFRGIPPSPHLPSPTVSSSILSITVSSTTESSTGVPSPHVSSTTVSSSNLSCSSLTSLDSASEAEDYMAADPSQEDNTRWWHGQLHVHKPQPKSSSDLGDSLNDAGACDCVPMWSSLMYPYDLIDDNHYAHSGITTGRVDGGTSDGDAQCGTGTGGGCAAGDDVTAGKAAAGQGAVVVVVQDLRECMQLVVCCDPPPADSGPTDWVP